MQVKIIEVVFAAAYVVSSFGCINVNCTSVYDGVEFVLQKEKCFLVPNGAKSEIIEGEDLNLLANTNMTQRVFAKGRSAHATRAPLTTKSTRRTPSVAMSQQNSVEDSGRGLN